jgi:hypothetical protein
MKDGEDLELLIRVPCSVCLSGIRKGVFTNCPYCDIDRKQIIEASLKSIKKYLNENLTREQKDDLIKELSK